MAEAGQLGLGQLQAVAADSRPTRAGTPTALAASICIPNSSTKNRRLSCGERRQQLGVADVGDVVDRLAHRLHFFRAGRRGRTTAPAGQLLALDALALGALARRVEHLLEAARLDDRDAVGVEHDDVARGGSWPRRRPPARRSCPPRPCGAAHANPARPDRQPELGQLLDVAHRGVDEDRGGALRLSPASRAGRRQARPAAAPASSARAPRPARPRAIAACTIRLSSCPHITVRAGPAARDPGTTCIEVGIDIAAPAAGLVHGRRPELARVR